jgi:hypothetical protein
MSAFVGFPQRGLEISALIAAFESLLDVKRVDPFVFLWPVPDGGDSFSLYQIAEREPLKSELLN